MLNLLISRPLANGTIHQTNIYGVNEPDFGSICEAITRDVRGAVVIRNNAGLTWVFGRDYIQGCEVLAMPVPPPGGGEGPGM